MQGQVKAQADRDVAAYEAEWRQLTGIVEADRAAREAQVRGCGTDRAGLGWVDLRRLWGARCTRLWLQACGCAISSRAATHSTINCPPCPPHPTPSAQRARDIAAREQQMAALFKQEFGGAAACSASPPGTAAAKGRPGSKGGPKAGDSASPREGARASEGAAAGAAAGAPERVKQLKAAFAKVLAATGEPHLQVSVGGPGCCGGH